MDHKLVSVRRIAFLHPIKRRRAVLAGVGGWTCTVQPNEFEVGELIVFFGPDAFLPAADERFAYLKHIIWCCGQKGYHVRSRIVGNSISHGLIMPLSKFPEIANILEEIRQNLPYDETVAELMKLSFDELLGVKKLVLEPKLSERSILRPPIFTPKTDIKRDQNQRTLLNEYNNDNIYQKSTKVDGCLMTVYFVRRGSQFYEALFALPGGSKANLRGGRVGICSRSYELPAHSDGAFWPVAWRNGLPEKLANLDRNLVIQGELCGYSISGNKEGFREDQHEF
ncbi:hypothetical protein SLS62_010962 [Diatrype stigma]|uniref:RNA ligase domain-containing protein n=1 Tax=Diatrype stigma TaxID=117547 RepID=A0AAN9U936_9PEZI